MIIDNLDLIILKTLISNRKYAIEFVNECDVSIFSTDVIRFAKLIIDYIRTFKDLPTQRILIDKVKSNEKFVEYINDVWKQIDDTKYNQQEYAYDLQKLKNRFAEKQINILQSSLSNPRDISKHLAEIQKTVSNIKQLSRYKTFESKTLKEALPAFVDRFQAKRNNKALETGIKTYYSFIDHAVNGIKPADMVIIAGESGFGKSILLQNLAINIWLQDNDIQKGAPFTPGKNIIYFSLEMPFDECFNRLISRLSMVPSRKIENAELNKEEMTRVKAALDFINKYPNQFKIIDMVDASANDIERIVSDTDFAIDSVFIDYLGILQPNEAKQGVGDWQVQGEIAYEVRAIGRKHNLPIFTAVQLNRKTAGKDSETIGLSRVARSNSISTHATLIIQIESRPNETAYPDLPLHIIKNRKGIRGSGSVLKNFACACLTDVPIKQEENMDSYFPNIDNVDISEDIEELEQLELEGD